MNKIKKMSQLKYIKMSLEDL